MNSAAMLSRHHDRRQLRNDVGLLSEDYDPLRRRLAGNFPLAASHLALAEAAAALDSLRTSS
jgi:GH15 family glucan-1,4-alpha-glucosidase